MRLLRTAVSVGVLVGLDLWSKSAVASRFSLGQSKSIIPGFFNITLSHNTGAAFGMGARLPGALFIGVTILAIGFMFGLLYRAPYHQKWQRTGLIFIMSGAIGNLVDRVQHGYVIDFLDFYYKSFHYWFFNLADAWIVIGVACLIIEQLFCSAKRHTSGA